MDISLAPETLIRAYCNGIFPMAEGKEIWCQLFSEPSAGSDVAGLRSKAVQDLSLIHI